MFGYNKSLIVVIGKCLKGASGLGELTSRAADCTTSISFGTRHFLASGSVNTEAGSCLGLALNWCKMSIISALGVEVVHQAIVIVLSELLTFGER